MNHEEKISDYIKKNKLSKEVPVILHKIESVNLNDKVVIKTFKNSVFKTNKMVCFSFYKNIF